MSTIAGTTVNIQPLSNAAQAGIVFSSQSATDYAVIFPYVEELALLLSSYKTGGHFYRIPIGMMPQVRKLMRMYLGVSDVESKMVCVTLPLTELTRKLVQLSPLVARCSVLQNHLTNPEQIMISAVPLTWTLRNALEKVMAELPTMQCYGIPVEQWVKETGYKPCPCLTGHVPVAQVMPAAPEQIQGWLSQVPVSIPPPSFDWLSGLPPSAAQLRVFHCSWSMEAPATYWLKVPILSPQVSEVLEGYSVFGESCSIPAYKMEEVRRLLSMYFGMSDAQTHLVAVDVWIESSEEMETLYQLSPLLTLCKTPGKWKEQKQKTWTCIPLTVPLRNYLESNPKLNCGIHFLSVEEWIKKMGFVKLSLSDMEVHTEVQMVPVEQSVGLLECWDLWEEMQGYPAYGPALDRYPVSKKQGKEKGKVVEDESPPIAASWLKACDPTGIQGIPTQASDMIDQAYLQQALAKGEPGILTKEGFVSGIKENTAAPVKASLSSLVMAPEIVLTEAEEALLVYLQGGELAECHLEEAAKWKARLECLFQKMFHALPYD
jgi:hypothetical protein